MSTPLSFNIHKEMKKKKRLLDCTDKKCCIEIRNIGANNLEKCKNQPAVGIKKK
jgi:hypothetical protein